MTSLIEQFAQHGVPTLILGFILFFILKPLVNSYIGFIDNHTEILQQMKNELAEIKESHHDIKGEIGIIKSDIKEIKTKLP